MAACEKSESWSFHRLSPRMEANSGEWERLYSHCSARSLLRVSRRAWRSAGDAAQTGTVASKSAASRNFNRIEDSPFMAPSIRKRGSGVTDERQCEEGSAFRRQNVKQDRKVVEDAAGEDEQVPYRVVVG